MPGVGGELPPMAGLDWQRGQALNRQGTGKLTGKLGAMSFQRFLRNRRTAVSCERCTLSPLRREPPTLECAV